MRGKRARALRRLSGCDLSKDGDNRDVGMVENGIKYIGVIDGVDGNHHIRDEKTYEARTTEERYLYRQMKRVWKQTEYKPKIREELVTDLKPLMEEKL